MEEILKQYFGYDEFRPIQKNAIQDILDKKDVFVLMPTGGGKSLCYQIPALILEGTAVVVSPLISLMKDQVDALRQNGIEARSLNSDLSNTEQAEVLTNLRNNKIKILYIAPERLFQENFLELLKKINISFFAIDEAHCISEWGHDFRPEYKQLGNLKSSFPNAPIIALTATATEKVQLEIVKSLNLNKASQYKASFDRANLFYQIRDKQNAYDQLLEYIKSNPDESGIIYVFSKKSVDDLVYSLNSDGVKALAYHAGLSNEIRGKNQDKFIKDEVNIIVATIAFGMGINKPDVRFVIHYDLPANLERYYQETGRAGRDGLDSQCILFFSYGNKVKIEYFIQQKENEHQREIAYKNLRSIIEFAEGTECRRKNMLRFFGEEYPKDNCEKCDNCISKTETFDATILAQKILSCVARVNQNFGVTHISKILLGAKTRRVIELGHDKLSVYGIIKEYSAKELDSYIRELIRLGYLEMTSGQFPVIRLSPKSWSVLKSEEKVTLHEPRILGKPSKSFVEKDIEFELLNILKRVRKDIANSQNLPPYMIFPDASLQEMATYLPQDKEAFNSIKGVGSNKLQLYGDRFIEEIKKYCALKNIEPVHRTVQKKKQNNNSTSNITLKLINSGLSIEEVAKQRNISPMTVFGHLEKAVSEGLAIDVDINKFVEKDKQTEIKKAFDKLGLERLNPVKEFLGNNYSYDELKWIRMKLITSAIDADSSRL